MESLSSFYIVLPTVEDYIVIPSAEGHTAIPCTEDCFIIHFFYLFMLLNVISCKLCSEMSFIYIHSLLNDLPYTFYLRICVIQCIQRFALSYFMICFVRIYIVRSIIEDIIVILSAEDCIAIPSIVD